MNDILWFTIWEYIIYCLVSLHHKVNVHQFSNKTSLFWCDERFDSSQKCVVSAVPWFFLFNIFRHCTLSISQSPAIGLPSCPCELFHLGEVSWKFRPVWQREPCKVLRGRGGKCILEATWSTCKSECEKILTNRTASRWAASPPWCFSGNDACSPKFCVTGLIALATEGHCNLVAANRKCW